MKQTGLIFQPDMARANVAGLKTMTRRTRGLEYINESPWGNDTDTSGKIDADVYVDDRGLHFNGDWDDARRKVDERARKQLETIHKRFTRKSWANVISDAYKNNVLIEMETAADHAELHGITDKEKLDLLPQVFNAAGGKVLDQRAYRDALEEIAAILQDRWSNAAEQGTKQFHAAGPDLREWVNGRDKPI